MKNLLVGLAVVGSVVGLADVASAGTGVTNRTTVRNSRGNGRVDFTSVDRYDGVQVNKSQSLKMEADLGDVNITNVRFDGSKLTGSAHSSNQRPVDPVSIGSFSSQYERLNVSGVSKASGFERYSFNERTNEHNVESYSF